MQINNLLKHCKIVIVGGAVAAGTDGSFQNLTEVDMTGYDSVMLVALIGTVTGSGAIELRAKNSDTTATYGSGTVDRIATATLTGSANSNKVLVLDCGRVQEEFLRGEYQRTTANVVITGVIAVLYNAHDLPAGAGDVVASSVVSGATPSTT